MIRKLDYFLRRLSGKDGIKSIETRFANEIIQPLHKESLILDVGCGDSFWAKNWVVKGRYIVPMDSVKCRNQPLPYVRADIRQAPFRNESFDVVNCVCTIEHIGLASAPFGANEDLKAMEEMKRILKEDGTLILTAQIGFEYFKEGYPQRNYSKERIKLLIRGWKITRAETYGNFGDGWNKQTWKRATWNQILAIPKKISKELNEWYGDICLSLRKERN